MGSREIEFDYAGAQLKGRQTDAMRGSGEQEPNNWQQGQMVAQQQQYGY